MDFLHDMTEIVQHSVGMAGQQNIVLGCVMGVILLIVMRRRKPSRSIIRVHTNLGWWGIRHGTTKKRRR